MLKSRRRDAEEGVRGGKKSGRETGGVVPVPGVKYARACAIDDGVCDDVLNDKLMRCAVQQGTPTLPMVLRDVDVMRAGATSFYGV